MLGNLTSNKAFLLSQSYHLTGEDIFSLGTFGCCHCTKVCRLQLDEQQSHYDACLKVFRNEEIVGVREAAAWKYVGFILQIKKSVSARLHAFSGECVSVVFCVCLCERSVLVYPTVS